LLLLLVGAAGADTVKPGSGELLVHDRNGATRELASLDTTVDFQVSGLVAEVAVHQRFRNDSGAWLEGEYLLPLPVGAAVYAMSLHIGERTIIGEVREKQAARQVFAQARDSGHKAALVEADGDNLFRTAVTNVGAGESVEVELHYWQRIDYADGLFSLRFPLTYTPRYTMRKDAPTATADPGIQGGQRFAEGRDEPPLTTHIHVTLDPGMALQSLRSPSHDIVSRQDGARWQVRLRKDEVPPDRDFVLQWQPLPQAQPHAASFSEDVDGAHYNLLMLMPPASMVGERLPRELILVIDTSGSMGGESIRQARAAIDMALSQLHPQDRFNVAEFNSGLWPWRPQAVQATSDAVADARAWVAQLQARGGTEMAPALHFALSGKAPAGYVRQVVFATDGAVDNPGGLMQLIDTELGDSRLFPIGIGSAPNGGFLTAAALHGRGSVTLIADLHQVQHAMRVLLTKLDQPAMTDLRADWPADAQVYPRQLPDLYFDEPLLLVARLPQAVSSVQVHGRLRDREVALTATLGSSGAAAGLDRLWAQARIADLEDRLSRGGDAATLRPQIVDTALHAHLVSRYTSLVAVDRTPVRDAKAPLTTTQLPNLMPAGTVFAQTATSAPLQMALALLALALGLLLWCAQRGRGHA
jgi:Ca-activated chloride channel family protein